MGIWSCSLPLFFMEKGNINFSIHWTLVRDWRGSNPQLPPWQGGALTNWTTIPGKGVYSIHIFTVSFKRFSFSISDSNHFAVNERGGFLYILIDIYIDMHFCEIDTDYEQSFCYWQIDWKWNQWKKTKKYFFVFLNIFPRFSIYRSWYESRLLARFEFVER